MIYYNGCKFFGVKIKIFTKINSKIHRKNASSKNKFKNITKREEF